MISVSEARQIITASCKALPSVEILITDAVGYVLAEDVHSPLHLPAFRQSSMDGYAIRFVDKEKTLPVQDELPAGTSKQTELISGNTIKVFTGGPVPEGADTVVQKEWVLVTDQGIVIQDNRVELYANIRNIGADISKDTKVMPAGTLAQPMHIGLLAALGVTGIQVIRKPKVAIVITGNELIQPGNPLAAGQVYESNSFALTACLRQMQITNVAIFFAKDNPAETVEAISGALNSHDLVLITGGVSVGDYDFVAKACDQLGIEQRFHGVKQRPGKPLLFGTLPGKWIFGLPGNPASVLSCFYQYVIPAIQILSGAMPPVPEVADLKDRFEKKAPLQFFLKGFCKNGIVEILSGQASFQVSPFLQANCWVELPETTTIFEKGDKVNIYPFV